MSVGSFQLMESRSRKAKLIQYNRVESFPMLVTLWRALKRSRAQQKYLTPPQIKLPPAALALWNERPDLRLCFDLHRSSGRRGLAQWFMFHGLAESGIELGLADLAALAPWHGPRPNLPCEAELPISWLMFAAARREGITLSELRNPDKQKEFVRWYVCSGLTKYGWSALLSDMQVAALMVTDERLGIPRLLAWLWESKPDLQSRFSGPESPEFCIWLRTYGGSEWPLLTDPRIQIADSRRPPADTDLPFGVNLVGHARGRLGVGEDVRMAAAALAAADVPYVICDFAAGSGIEPEDKSVVADIRDEMPYRFTIICTTGMETVRAVHELGATAFIGRTVIGFWPWEMAEWPRIWQGAYRLVDEVWASTRYTYNAYLRSSPVPVRQLPMAVKVDESDGLHRRDFDLPQDQFLYVFAFDGLSHTSRKNPWGCVEAFDRAFPRGDEPVGLVIKGMRVAGNPGWEALVERAKSDKRLFLINQSLTRGALLDLYRACDCFLSLHRAEGFGRNIAECMALGLPVIVTAHSGNTDFTQWDTAALVPISLRPVEAREYPFSTGQSWAEPDLDVAANLMRVILTDVDWRNRISQAGRQRIAELYAPERVGQCWKAALIAITDEDCNEAINFPSKNDNLEV